MKVNVGKLTFEVIGELKRVSAYDSEYVENPKAEVELSACITVKGKTVQAPVTLRVPTELENELFKVYKQIREWAEAQN